MYGCANGCATIPALLFFTYISRNGCQDHASRIDFGLAYFGNKKEFSNIFSNNWPNVALKDASNSVQATSPAAPAKEIADMVADLRPLFYSPKEQRLLDYLTEHGPSVQTAIIAYF